MGAKDVVQLYGITKQFSGVNANESIDLTLRIGEIHALLGENGAGKTTLMNILSGLYRPDAGTISIWGEKVVLRNPRSALAHGIGMVHQHFELVNVMTVGENIVLGHRPSGFFVNRKKIKKTLNNLYEQYGFMVDPDAYIWQLSVGEQQRVEIIRLLYRGAELMILDEPTAVLTPGQATEMYASLRKMAGIGKAVVFITHKLDEVMSVADRITVLRNGKVAGSVAKKDTTIGELTKLMIGRELSARPARKEQVIGEPTLKLQGICALGDRGLPVLHEINLDLHEGEILGIAGVSGNGQRELAEVIAGVRPPTAGSVSIGDTDITAIGPLAVMNAGIRYIPAERIGTGLAPHADLVDNVILRDFRKKPFKGRFLLDRRAAHRYSEAIIKKFGVLTLNNKVKVRDLSGGNQQKLLVGRELSADPKILIVEQPTRGLDIGATDAVRQYISDLREKRVGTLLISEDLDEILALSDRVAVLFGGRILGIINASEANRENIGALMGGRTERGHSNG